MKIAFLADSFLPDPSTGVNGTQVQMYNLATALVRRGVDVHYVAFTRDWRRAHDVVDDLTVRWLPLRRQAFGWLREVQEAGRAVAEIDPDIVYQRGRSHLTHVAARWARETARRFVWASNGEDSGELWKLGKRVTASNRPAWKKAALYPYVLPLDLLVHRGVRGASGIIAQTEHQQDRIRRTFGKESTILPSVFPQPAHVNDAAKEKLMLWLANLHAGKQPEVFIDLAEACGALDGWAFLLAGGTSDRAYQEAVAGRAAEVGNLQMTGAVPFMKSGALFARASLFVNTSRREADGLSNAFIQAWHHGTPVLSLNHDPNGWISRHGLGFCAHGDRDAFLKQGRALAADHDALIAMGKRCKTFARNTFASDDIIDAYLNAFAG